MNEFFSRPQRRDVSVSPEIVVGLGARACATAAEVLSLIDATLAEAGLGRADLALCLTLDRRLSHPALQGAADALDVPLLGRSATELDLAVLSPSATVERLAGVASVAEAAALSMGSLIVGKRRSGNATCALARILPAHAAMLASAASTLSTSRAGP